MRRGHLTWTLNIFWLAALSPGFIILPATGAFHFQWSTAFAETQSTASTAESLLTLNQAVEQALLGNPSLGEIKARAEAMATLPSQASALPDPSFNVDLINVPTNSFNLQQEDMTMLELGVSQTIPFPGKRPLKEKIAEQEALAAAESVAEARLRLARDVKQAWWSLFYYDRAMALLDETEQIFRQLIASTQSKYKVGKGMQQDVLLAQLELSKLSDEKLDLISMRHNQSARFNVLLDRLPKLSVRLPSEAEFKLPILVESALQDKAIKTRPLFAQHQKMLEAASTKVELAKQEFYPDITVGAAYAIRQNTPSGEARSDFASVRLSLNLPIYANQKQSKALAQSQSELLQERYALLDEHHKIQAEIAAKLADYQHAKEKLALLEREIIPQIQQTLDSLTAGYQVGQVNFSELLRTQLSFLQYQTQYWRSLTNTQQILAALSAEVGEELTHD
jgi:outer membrane protein TolC